MSKPWIGGGALFVLVGCSASSMPAPATSDLQEGLNVLSADPAIGVSVAFLKEGRVVYLDTAVGKLKDENYRMQFPDEPQNEMDARVVDQEGHTFELVIGGDELIQPTWAVEMRAVAQISSPDQGIQRNADFVLAREAADAFLVQAGPELADHVLHLTTMTRIIPQENAHLIERAAAAQSALPLPTNRAYTANGCTSNLQEGDLYSKPYLYSSLPGQHSAVSGWNYNGCTGSWDENVITCNHGTCANAMSTYQCSSYSNGWSVWSYNALLDYWSRETNTTTNNGGNTGACWSGYGVDVADITWTGSGDPNHDCHDDSALELDEIRYARYDAGTWSGGPSGNSCYHSTHWYGPLNSAINAPSCP